MSAATPYVGRFAPSPTGPLHAGSLLAALASWLDARAHGGRWLVRIEDVDRARCPPGLDHVILRQLQACGLVSDALPWWQSHRDQAYAQALAQLQASGQAYACGCTRRDVDAALAAAGQPHQRFGERIYPGTCRGGRRGDTTRAWRFRVSPGRVDWVDRRLGPQGQDVEHSVGDFVLARPGGHWTYQLAVVVDDAAQGITHVVRGEDLADNTARQILLQRALGMPTPSYLHTPLVRAADGHKLSKQNGAEAFDTTQPLRALQTAASALGLPELPPTTLGDFLAAATAAWAGIMRDPTLSRAHP